MPEDIEIELNPLVMANVEKMYDLYFEVAMTSTDKPIMSFADFMNQLIVRGIVEYHKQLIKLKFKEK